MSDASLHKSSKISERSCMDPPQESTSSTSNSDGETHLGGSVNQDVADAESIPDQAQIDDSEIHLTSSNQRQFDSIRWRGQPTQFDTSSRKPAKIEAHFAPQISRTEDGGVQYPMTHMSLPCQKDRGIQM